MDAKRNFLKNYNLEGELLKIIPYPSPTLKKKAEIVENFDESLKTLVKNMFFTMYKSPGIGLAAPQVGELKRIFIVDIDFTREKILSLDGNEEYRYSNFNPQVFINPEIIESNGSLSKLEGCLSFPGLYEKVNRANEILVSFYDLNGEKKEIKANDLLSICIQHEYDHLDGILFIEKLSLIKRKLLLKKYTKKKF